MVWSLLSSAYPETRTVQWLMHCQWEVHKDLDSSMAKRGNLNRTKGYSTPQNVLEEANCFWGLVEHWSQIVSNCIVYLLFSWGLFLSPLFFTNIIIIGVGVVSIITFYLVSIIKLFLSQTMRFFWCSSPLVVDGLCGPELLAGVNEMHSEGLPTQEWHNRPTQFWRKQLCLLGLSEACQPNTPLFGNLKDNLKTEEMVRASEEGT